VQQDPKQPTPRYSWRTLLQAVGIGLAGQVLTLLVLNPIVTHDIALPASCGVLWAAIIFWSPVARRRRYWPDLVVITVTSVVLWVLTARLLSLFGLL
jgi:hypothetical protein